MTLFRCQVLYYIEVCMVTWFKNTSWNIYHFGTTSANDQYIFEENFTVTWL